MYLNDYGGKIRIYMDYPSTPKKDKNQYVLILILITLSMASTYEEIIILLGGRGICSAQSHLGLLQSKMCLEVYTRGES